MADYEDASVQSRVQCAHRNIFDFLRHLRDIATDLMSDVAPLKQRKRIKRRAPKKHRKYATHLQHCIDKFRQGRYTIHWICYLLSVILLIM